MHVQKNFFTDFLRAFFVICVALALGISPFMARPARAQQVVHYKTYHPGTGEEFNRFYGTAEKNLSGGYQVRWVIEEAGTVTEEDYTLDEDFGTLRFRVVNIEEGTDYVGEKSENEIFIRGLFRGKAVEETMEIDERPFYYNPKIGLTAFVRSGEKRRKFWGFQNRELKVYPMKAVNEGPETISVNGQKVEAVRVHWTADDFRSAFFKRVYWFRKSDGLYLKQKTQGGKFRELVSEEGGL